MTNLTKKLLGGVALSAMLAVPAMSADLPARAPARAVPAAVISADYNWTGFYIGGHAGYGWGDSAVTTSPGGAPIATIDIDGFVGGGHVGINYQINRLVLGLEGAVSLGTLDGSLACAPGGGVTTCRGDIDHFWRAGGRLGFAAGPTGNWLIYGMGGFARAKFDTWGTTAAGVEVGRDSIHHHGWYGGGGIEYAIGPNFIVGVEAYHVALGNEVHAAGTPFARNVDLDFTVVQARASYKFGWGGPVVARY